MPCSGSIAHHWASRFACARRSYWYPDVLREHSHQINDVASAQRVTASLIIAHPKSRAKSCSCSRTRCTPPFDPPVEATHLGGQRCPE
eukprot:5514799-Prymnesium_polylepis.1